MGRHGARFVLTFVASIVPRVAGHVAQSYTPGVFDDSAVANRSQLHLGDCLAVLNTLPDHSVDLILSDPPYGVNYLSRSHSLPLTQIANDGQEAYTVLDQALAIAWW